MTQLDQDDPGEVRRVTFERVDVDRSNVLTSHDATGSTDLDAISDASYLSSTDQANQSSRSPWWSILIRYQFRIVRDVIAFLIRGGVSALLFFIDQIINIFIFSTEAWAPQPVPFIVTHPTRLVTWCFQTAIWIVYTAVELLFYLPPPLLLIYVILVLGLYSQSPEAVDTILYLMYWSASWFLKLLKIYVWGEYNQHFEEG